MTVNNPKRQHWVPRFYLREFATPETRATNDPQVWVVSKKPKSDRDELPFKINIENVAAESFLYAPLRDDGTRDFSIETLLGGMEGLLSRQWDHIANDFVDLAAEGPLKKMLALFVATMIARHPDKVDRMKVMHKRDVRFYEAIPKDSLGRPKISHVIHEGEHHEIDVSGWDEFRDADENYIRQMFVENIRPAGMQISADLLTKKWSIVVANEPVFATSDRPVYMSHPTATHFGTRTPGTLIEFPLSPTRLLMLHDFPRGPQFGYHPLKGGPAPVNLTTWLGADRFFIASTDPTPLIAQLLKFTQTVERKLKNTPNLPLVPGRNSPCPCGSGRKWKRCCGRNG